MNKELRIMNDELGNYRALEFITNEMKDVYAVADLVITRAGINVLNELAVLKKPAIIIPIPDSHQEMNAGYFEKRRAAIVYDERELDAEKFVSLIQRTLGDKNKLSELAENISKLGERGAVKKIVDVILKSN